MGKPSPHGNAQRAFLEEKYRRKESPFPLAKELGLRFTHLEPGRAVLELKMGPRFHNPAGIVHGGVVFGLLDTAMGFAATSVLEGPHIVQTVDVKVNFIRALRKGRATAEAHVVRKGRTVIVLEAWLRDAEGELAAQALGTAIVVAASPGQAGRGARQEKRGPRGPRGASPSRPAR